VDYPLGDKFSMHFAHANLKEREQNKHFLCELDLLLQGLTLDAPDPDALRKIKSMLQRPVRRSSLLGRELPLVMTDLGFTVHLLLVTVPTCRWPRTGIDFACPNPHCFSCRDVIMQHLRDHVEICQDVMFSDSLVATLAALIGCRIDMADAIGFSCTLFGLDCSYRYTTLWELKQHVATHPGRPSIFSRP
jgi:hypothetical protein